MGLAVMPARLTSADATVGHLELLKLAHVFARKAMRLPTSYEYKIETPRRTLPESYCAGCIDSAFEAEAAKWPEEERQHLSTSMSAGVEYDGRAHCHKCGLILDCRLSEYGGEAELRHFSAIQFTRLRPPSEVEMFHLWKMLEALAYHIDVRKIALALRIGRRALAATATTEP